LRNSELFAYALFAYAYAYASAYAYAYASANANVSTGDAIFEGLVFSGIGVFPRPKKTQLGEWVAGQSLGLGRVGNRRCPGALLDRPGQMLRRTSVRAVTLGQADAKPG
jgi:hypothetical protein